MAEEINHWCVVCGKGYHACDSCNETKSFNPWRKLTDSIEHFKIFTVLKDYNNKIIDKTEAQRLLKNVDLSGRETFKASAKKVLDDIFEEEVRTKSIKPKRNVKNVLEHTLEDNLIEGSEIE